MLNYLLDLPNTDRVVEDSVRVLRALPAAGARVDRRLLATEVLADPHGLDEGQPVASVVRALLAAGGLVSAGERPCNAWRAVGVDSDELTGGLGALGIHPVDWRLPAAALVTLPPIELAACQWPAPDEPEAWVFVTENPSVLTAARQLAAAGKTPRLLCTSGTPSTLETAALGRLSDAGWRVAVQADFDESGLKHVAAILVAAPSATPWRMSTSDYLATVDPLSELRLRQPDQLQSSWDPTLSETMGRVGIPALEEAMLADLLDDLQRGRPRQPLSSPQTRGLEALS